MTDKDPAIKSNERNRYMVKKMKRVIIIGCPGSGKSTFARALQQKTALPLYHLDMLYWNKDKTTVAKSVFAERLAAILQEDAWIIDGNYASTIEQRLQACDTVILLDYPTDVCLDGIKARQGKPRSDMPWVETQEDAEFISFVQGFNKQQRPQIMALLAACSDKNIFVLTSRSQGDAFLNEEAWRC